MKNIMHVEWKETNQNTMGKTQVIKTASIELDMVVYTFSPSSQRKQQNDLCWVQG